MEVAKVAEKGTVNWLHVRQFGEKMPINVTVTDPLPKTKDGYEYILLYPSMASEPLLPQHGSAAPSRPCPLRRGG